MSGQRITIGRWGLAVLVCGLLGSSHDSHGQPPAQTVVTLPGAKLQSQSDKRAGIARPTQGTRVAQRPSLGFVPAHAKAQGKATPVSANTLGRSKTSQLGTTPSSPTGSVATAAHRQQALADGIELDLNSPSTQQTGNSSAVAPANYVVTEGVDGGMIMDSGMAMPASGGWCGSTCFDISGEYLYWQSRGMNLPALVTSSPNGTLQEDAGVLTRPGTNVLFGNSAINNEDRSGYRVNFGIYTDPSQLYGISFIYTDLEEASNGFQASATNTILARPFFNTVENDQDSRLISFPDLVSGSVQIDTSTDFNSLDALVAVGFFEFCQQQVSFFIGYRYATLDDLVRIQESTRSLSGVTSGTTFNLFDQFDTENQFHGGELAMRYRTSAGWGTSLEVLTRVALGSTNSTAEISGQTVTTATSGTTTTERGLLVQSSNVGNHSDDNLSTISEIGFTLRRDLGYGLIVRAGYSLLYWSDVMRAGDQIDLTVNPTQIPPGSLTGTARPRFPNDIQSFWAQGLHVGLEFPF